MADPRSHANVVEARGLTKRYAGTTPKTVLDDVDVTVAAGEVLGIQGPSGAGKSTLLHLLGALDPPTSGHVAITGADPWALDAAGRAALRLRQIGFVFQSPRFVAGLDVLANVALPARAAGVARPDAEARAARLLSGLGLAGHATADPSVLSGGEAQRVAIARALVNAPPLLVLDEPTAHLDDDAADAVGADVARFAQGGGAVVLATHDPRAVPLLHRTMRLAKGRVVNP